MNVFAQGNLGELIISAMHHTFSIYAWFLPIYFVGESLVG
jgi:hypothetical protein